MFDFEDEFVQRLISQDEQAFAQFYNMTADIFFRYLTGHYFLSSQDIQDLLSDFYLKCRNWLGGYNQKYSFETYIRTILKNHTKDFFKKRKSVQLKDEHIQNEALSEWWEDELLKELQQDFELEMIQEAMGMLDEQSYEVIYHRFIDEMSYEEMSSILDMSQDAVRQRLSRALKKLKQGLWLK